MHCIFDDACGSTLAANVRPLTFGRLLAQVHVETTMTTDQDVTVVDTLHQALAQQNRLPAVHLVDGAYTSGEKLVTSQHDYQMDLMGPMRQDQSWQAHDAQAFDISHVQIDWEQEIVLCPMGKQSRPWKPSQGPRSKPTFQVSFYRKDCAACRVRERCTRSTTAARGLTLHPQAQHLALQAARERQHTEHFKEDYKRRAGIEGTISQAAFALGMRRTRYRGLHKTHFRHLATPTVSPLIIPLLYCSINGFQRASSVARPLPGGEKRRDGWAAYPVAW
jgi:transposase